MRKILKKSIYSSIEVTTVESHAGEDLYYHNKNNRCYKHGWIIENIREDYNLFGVLPNGKDIIKVLLLVTNSFKHETLEIFEIKVELDVNLKGYIWEIMDWIPLEDSGE